MGDTSNDFDSDMICGDVDSCALDDENDADSDRVCGNFDLCPYDPENDIDRDGKCAYDCGYHPSQYKYHTSCSSITSKSNCSNAFEISKDLASPCCPIDSSV